MITEENRAEEDIRRKNGKKQTGNCIANIGQTLDTFLLDTRHFELRQEKLSGRHKTL